MNAAYAYERAAAAETFHREHCGEAQAAHQAALISTAAKCLATVTRDWRAVPPRAEIDAMQLEGMRIVSGNHTAIRKRRRNAALL